MLITISVRGVITVARVGELSAGVKSASKAPTRGALMMVPLVIARVVMVTWALAPLGSVPRLQITPLVFTTQFPTVLIAEMKARLEGKGLVRFTNVAEDGPRLVTFSV